MKKIAIHGRKIKSDSIEHIEGLIVNLINREANVYFSTSFLEQNSGHFNLFHKASYANNLDEKDFNLAISIGGDGTLLETVTHVGRSDIPILGINTGRLGFLATMAKDEIDVAIEKVFNGDFSIEKRSLIELETPTELFKERNFALNEFAILRKGTSSMISVKCYLNDSYLNTYWVDGLMVSTPTGSTGYSLSCGGPIMMPLAKNFLITPVSPHNLNIRPLVVPDNSQLSFQIDSRETNLLISLDSRSATIDDDIEIRIKKADFSVSLVSLEGSNFVESLRNKLGWGFDKRN